MPQIIAYALAISAALSLAAFCKEKLEAMMGRPRRVYWVAMMLLSILWPLGMMLWARPVTAPAPVAMQPVEQQLAVMPGKRSPAIVDEALRDTESHGAVPVPAQVRRMWRGWLPSDRTLLLAWAGASGLLLLYLACTDLLLHHRASRWRRETVLGQPVLVSELTGPALLGAWRPQIVVPRWFLDEPAATQILILEHERQHVAARDPLLLRLALLIVAAAPWNLPLWWQLRRLRRSIELDCDARVLRSGAEARAYGEVLLAVTQRAGSVPRGAIAMSEPVSALEIRIRHLTKGPPRYYPLHALVATVFSGVGIGGAFALQVPPLPHGPAMTAVPAAPVSLPSLASLAQPAAATQRPILVAAQTSPARSNSAPPALPGEAVRALPRLRPPTGYSITPRDYDDPRSRERAGAAVQAAWATRSDLSAAINGDPVINTVKHLTVFMTEDGKVDRFYVTNDPLPLGDMVYGDGVSTGLAGIVPELLVGLWEPLGLRPEELGQMGFTVLQQGDQEICVHYAWPRHPGEPLGGFTPNDGQSFRAAFTYADAVANVEHYLPGTFTDKGPRPAGIPWLLLSAQGEVVRSGYAATRSSLPLAVIAAAAPGAHVDHFMGMALARRVDTTDQVVFGWLAPDQPARLQP